MSTAPINRVSIYTISIGKWGVPIFSTLPILSRPYRHRPITVARGPSGGKLLMNVGSDGATPGIRCTVIAIATEGACGSQKRATCSTSSSARTAFR